MKKIYAIFAIVLSIACFFSCGKAEAPIVETTGVSLSTTTLSIYPGDVVKVDASVDPSTATSTYKTWATSNGAVATVDGWGRITGVAPGTCNITAKTASGGHTATCKVTVNPIDETSLTVEPAELTVYYDESETLTATILPSNASYKTVTWTSDDESVASVDETGKVKGVGLGSATITATSKNGLKASCRVTVAVRMPTEPEIIEVWKSDNAGFRGLYGTTSDEGASAGNGGWLKYENGAASWTANETGKVRTATLTLSTGSSITVTQLDAKDFVGSWKLTAKTFAPNKNLGVTANNNYVANLTIAAKEGTTANDGNAKLTNNLTVAGLINSYVAEAVVDIDYDAKSYRFGIFFNANKAQEVNTGKEGYDYIVLLPELGSGWRQYNFCPFPFNGTTGYGWMWFVTDSFTEMHYGKDDWYKIDGKDVLGMAFCACKSATPTVSDFSSVNLASGYDVIYQCNVGGKDNPGFQLVKE